MKEKAIAIITARGGSKRIPKKNIKEFCGKPILAYSIEAALNSGVFDEVMVSTDSEEIAEIAKRYGARIPFIRSNETANDFATTADVLMEVLNSYKEQGREFETLCCIYPTAPFVTPQKLRKAVQLLSQENVNAVLPVVRFSFPPQRGFCVENEMLQVMYPELYPKRSQDLEPMYHDCGQYYFIKTDVFLEKKTLVPEQTAPIITSELEVQDIDNEEDWELAELKYKKMSK